MKLGFSCVHRKLIKMKRSMSSQGIVYFLDESGRIIGRYDENDDTLTLFMQGKDGSKQLLTLAFNFKYKCGQDVIIADVAFLSEFVDNKVPVVVKSRDVRLAEDAVLVEHECTTIGTAYISDEDGLLYVSIPLLGVEAVQEKVIHREKNPTRMYNLLTRKVH